MRDTLQISKLNFRSGHKTIVICVVTYVLVTNKEKLALKKNILTHFNLVHEHTQ